jgi:hypothetical protein
MSYIAALAVPHGGVILREPTMPLLIERVALHIGHEVRLQRSADAGILAANIHTLASANLRIAAWDAGRNTFSVAG